MDFFEQKLHLIQIKVCFYMATETFKCRGAISFKKFSLKFLKTVFKVLTIPLFEK